MKTILYTWYTPNPIQRIHQKSLLSIKIGIFLCVASLGVFMGYIIFTLITCAIFGLLLYIDFLPVKTLKVTYDTKQVLTIGKESFSLNDVLVSYSFIPLTEPEGILMHIECMYHVPIQVFIPIEISNDIIALFQEQEFPYKDFPQMNF